MKIIKILSFTLLLTSCMKGKKVDMVFHNANITTLSDNNKTGEAMAIKNGKIIEIGPERQILNKYRADEITDVGGKEIVPTFTDCLAQIEKQINSNYLKEYELKYLQQGITKIHVHNVSYLQLKRLEEFRNKMELEWFINLEPSKENIDFIRKYKKNINSNFHIQGFTITNQKLDQIQEIGVISKNKRLQIGIDLFLAQQNIPSILNLLTEYNKDHRWFVFNLSKIDKPLLQQIQTQNLMFCQQAGEIKLNSIYGFGSNSNNTNIYQQLLKFTTKNNIDYISSLKSLSNWSSYLSFTENKSGSLSNGKDANFTILETSISSSSTFENIYSNSSYRKGKKIYSME